MTTSLVYQIRLKGHLGEEWSAWFDGMAITHLENGETVLSGQIVDQSALYGLLFKVSNLNMPLISMEIKKFEDGA